MAPRNRLHRFREETVSPRITLTPLIDTALVLLVIFMVATPLLDKHIKVDLPVGQAPDEKNLVHADPLTITIDQTGAIYYGARQVTLTELKNMIEQKITQEGIRGVIVAADQQVPYGVPFAVVDMLKATGLEYISFAERTR